MAVKFQYNKTSLQEMGKQLKIRNKALPTLKNKEAALRVEVKKAKKKTKLLEDEYQAKMKEYDFIKRMWNEFDSSLIEIEKVELATTKIAGVLIPKLKSTSYKIKEYSLFNAPTWFPGGIEILKEMTNILIKVEINQKIIELLEFARKKTTQKVNLYEKVQIPGYENAIRKIKRYLEDQDNLSKAAQKIVKNRKEKEAV